MFTFNSIHSLHSRFFFSVIITFVFIFAFFSIATITHAANLSLSPSKTSVALEETFTVDIILDTEGSATDGVDIHYLNFDPALLQVQSVEAGALYPSTQTNTFDNTAGTINFSQITTGGGTYTGQGTLASVTFKALASGKAILAFDFEEGNTKDSNVASAGSDVLTSADGGSYRVLSGEGIITLIVDFFKKIFPFLF